MKKQIYLLMMVLAIALTSCGGGGGGGSSSSDGQTGTIEPPGNVSASAGNTQVTITWEASAGAASYNLYWSTTPGVKKETGTKTEGVTSPYVHIGVPNGITNYNVVTAVNSAGLESAESAEVSATPVLLPPLPPSE